MQINGDQSWALCAAFSPSRSTLLLRSRAALQLLGTTQRIGHKVADL